MAKVRHNSEIYLFEQTLKFGNVVFSMKAGTLTRMRSRFLCLVRAILKLLGKFPFKIPLGQKFESYLRKAEIDSANNSVGIKNQIDNFFRENLDFCDLETYEKFKGQSTSQCRQDLIIAMLSEWSLNGQVIEVGATDGIFLSNSFMLEAVFNWDSVLVEPSRIWHKGLFRNRPNAEIFIDAVSSESGVKVKFTQTEFAELSGITSSLPSDYWSKERLHSIQYEVETITLDEICRRQIATDRFLAVSIDIEGGEFDAISGFVEFIKFASVILAENNGDQSKIESIDNLVFSHGRFVRIDWPFESFDSWYVNRDLLLTNRIFQRCLKDVEIIGRPKLSGL